jgi:hypothetical protein
MRDSFRIHFFISPGNSETTSATAETNRRFPRHVTPAALLICVLTLSRGITLTQIARPLTILNKTRQRHQTC